MDEMFLGLLGVVFIGTILIGSVLAIVNTFRLRALERNVAELTAKLAGREAGGVEPSQPEMLRGSEATASPEAALGPDPIPAPPREARPAAATPTKRLDLESLIAGRWLNRIGIFAVMLAAAFFLKFAFDNDWVGPTGRVAIGLVAGAGLMVASQWFLKRDYRYFSEGIAALGGGILFLSIYAAWTYYELIPQGVALAGMVAVTAALAALALARDSERMAVLALGAGLTTPGLLSVGVDSQIPLFTYLAVLVAIFLALALRKAWRWVAPAALLGFVGYFATWFESYYSANKLLVTCSFATLFFAEFAVFCWLRVRHGSPPGGLPGGLELLLVPANAAWFGITLHLMLYRDHRWWMTVAVLGLGVLHLVAARAIAGMEAEKATAVRLVVAGLALSFATAAIPIRLEGEWIHIALAIEAALLVWSGFRTRVVALRGAGLAILIVVIGRILVDFGPSGTPFLNGRFASFVVTAVALGFCVYLARQHEDLLSSRERPVVAIAAVATTFVTVWGLSVELWQFLGKQQWNLDPQFARQMGLSLLWTVAASLLILLGVRKESKALRIQGLVLLGITIGKVFLLDLSFLERAYRIASFLVLGIVLLTVSFWYQKSLAETHKDSNDEEEIS